MNKEKFIIELGQKIKTEREKQGLSQQKLAEKSNMSLHYLGCVERAEQNITIGKLYDVAQALNLPMTYFVNIC